jgi:hypothetical protein
VLRIRFRVSPRTRMARALLRWALRLDPHVVPVAPPAVVGRTSLQVPWVPWVPGSAKAE